MTPNELKQWMDFANQQGMFAGQRQENANPYRASYFDVPKMEAEWAMRMAGGDMPGRPQIPDYFASMGGTSGGNSGYAPGSYVAPAYVAGNVSGPASAGPLQGQITTYLSRFLSKAR